MRTRQLRIACAALLFSGACQGDFGPEDEDEIESGQTLDFSLVPSGQPVTAELAAGDRVASRGPAAIVPPPGYTVGAEAVLEDGTTETLLVTAQADGRVVVIAGDAEAAPPPEGMLFATAVCSDRAYNLAGTKWTNTHRWWMKTGSIPSSLPRDATLSAIRQAGSNITSSRNDCGRADYVSATIAYQGSTTRSPNITSSATCGSTDGYNVVGFGSLPGYLALTCWWSYGSQIVESDVRIATGYSWYLSGACSGTKYSLQDVMTHERGHTFGLNHVSEAYHPLMTMSPQIAPCSTQERTLGLGDMLGLEALY